MATKKITLRNYKFDEKNPSIELTMEQLEFHAQKLLKLLRTFANV